MTPKTALCGASSSSLVVPISRVVPDSAVSCGPEGVWPILTAPSQEPDTSELQSQGAEGGTERIFATMKTLVVAAGLMPRFEMCALVLTLALSAPVGAHGQIMRGVTEVPTDTVRRGVFFELGGPGELYSLNYEHHLRPATVLQAGFTRWSFQFLAPRHRARAGILTLLRQLSAPELLSEYVFAEFGGGIGRASCRERV